ncbi:hypothetical protein ACFOPX_04715 [Helicobacter baculiformis]|uniref:Uncharacterized protein n=1 Tax=Helicobacter baculiformis TaxID=427351 RepID=A0ABV7ZJJ2_9HELI
MFKSLHQLSTSKMPQRCFLPFDDQGVPSEALQRDIQEILSHTGKGGANLMRQLHEIIDQALRRS